MTARSRRWAKPSSVLGYDQGVIYLHAWAFKISDPVVFEEVKGRHVTGHIARKTRKHGIVLTREGYERRVRWEDLSHDRNGSRKRVKLETDVYKARFRPDDEVEFEFDGKDVRGVVARFGPRNARVVADDDQDYVVPYKDLRAVNPDPGRRDEVRLDRIARKAELLMAKHGLNGWSFQYGDAARQSGVCDHYTRVISLSHLYCLKAPAHGLRNTLLHEIAHALVGPAHNHDRVWKEKAREIGCTADRCHTVEFSPPKYIAWCVRCGTRYTRNIRRKTLCRTCERPLKFRTYTRKAWESFCEWAGEPARRRTAATQRDSRLARSNRDTTG